MADIMRFSRISEPHPSDSAVQRQIENVVRTKLAKELGLEFSDDHALSGLKVDAFCGGKKPVCVEIWAHQGCSKSAQKDKVMKDMCKLLLAERMLGRRCRKIIAVCDANALTFVENSWRGVFAREFGIEFHRVKISRNACERICAAQRRQKRGMRGP